MFDMLTHVHYVFYAGLCTFWYKYFYVSHGCWIVFDERLEELFYRIYNEINLEKCLCFCFILWLENTFFQQFFHQNAIATSQIKDITIATEQKSAKSLWKQAHKICYRESEVFICPVVFKQGPKQTWILTLEFRLGYLKWE